MLPEANNLFSILRVKLIQGAPNAIVGKSCDMRRVSKATLTIQYEINKSVSDLNFGRNVKQLAHMFHCESSSPLMRDPFSFEDVTVRNEMQTLTLVNNKQSFAMVLK